MQKPQVPSYRTVRVASDDAVCRAAGAVADTELDTVWLNQF